MSLKKIDVIELFGLPGAGKTSYYRSIKNTSQVTDRYFLPYSRVVIHIWHWLYLIVKEFYVTKSWTLTRLKLHFVYQLYFTKTNVIVGNHMYVDEGILQRILTVIERELTYTEAENIYKYFSPIKTVMCFEAPPEKLFQRYDAAHVRNKHASRDWKAIMVKNYFILKRVIEQNGCEIKTITRA